MKTCPIADLLTFRVWRPCVPAESFLRTQKGADHSCHFLCVLLSTPQLSFRQYLFRGQYTTPGTVFEERKIGDLSDFFCFNRGFPEKVVKIKNRGQILPPAAIYGSGSTSPSAWIRSFRSLFWLLQALSALRSFPLRSSRPL